MKKLFFLAVLAIFAASLSSAQVAEVSDTVENAVDNDSADYAKLKSAEYDALCLIAHFEAVRANAYWDPYGKKETIGIGNTVHYSGRPVKSTDRIKDKDELLLYFYHHVEKFIFPDMQKYLPVRKMSRAEIVVLISMFYNAGSGKLHKKDMSPSEFCRDLCDWFNTRNDKAKDKIIAYMENTIYSKGKRLEELVKRRAIEAKIFFGEIIMDNTGEYALENSVNFAEAPLGVIYDVDVADLANTKFVCDSINNCPYGKNLNDSIDWAFKHPNKRAAPKAKKTTTAKRPRTKSKRR